MDTVWFVLRGFTLMTLRLPFLTKPQPPQSVTTMQISIHLASTVIMLSNLKHSFVNQFRFLVFLSMIITVDIPGKWSNKRFSCNLLRLLALHGLLIKHALYQQAGYGPVLFFRVSGPLLSELSVQKVVVDWFVSIYMYSNAKACSWLFSFGNS